MGKHFVTGKAESSDIAQIDNRGSDREDDFQGSVPIGRRRA